MSFPQSYGMLKLTATRILRRNPRSTTLYIFAALGCLCWFVLLGRRSKMLLLDCHEPTVAPPEAPSCTDTSSTVGFSFNESELDKTVSLVLETLFRFYPGDSYSKDHGIRFAQTLLLVKNLFLNKTPRVLLAGEKGHVPILVHELLKVKDFKATSLDEPGHHVVRAASENYSFSFHIRRVNLEVDAWPYDDDLFDVVFLLEVLEHFTVNPMHALLEGRRVLAPGGFLILSTPNVVSLGGLLRGIQGHTPYTFSLFHSGLRGEALGLTHAREYALSEVSRMFNCTGFRVHLATTIEPYYRGTRLEHPFCDLDPQLVGTTLFFTAIKDKEPSHVSDCLRGWLYFDS